MLNNATVPFPVIYILTQLILDALPSEDKESAVFKNLIKIHSCQVLLSLCINIIFPGCSGSVENKINKLEQGNVDFTTGRCLPDASSPFGGWASRGTVCRVSIPLSNATTDKLDGPAPLLLPLLKSPGSKGNRASALASGFSKCLGRPFTFRKC